MNRYHGRLSSVWNQVLQSIAQFIPCQLLTSTLNDPHALSCRKYIVFIGELLRVYILLLQSALQKGSLIGELFRKFAFFFVLFVSCYRYKCSVKQYVIATKKTLIKATQQWMKNNSSRFVRDTTNVTPIIAISSELINRCVSSLYLMDFYHICMTVTK